MDPPVFPEFPETSATHPTPDATESPEWTEPQACPDHWEIQEQTDATD